MQNLQMDLNKVLEAVVPAITKEYFEENKEKHLADITGRVQAHINQRMTELSQEVIITINHRN